MKRAQEYLESYYHGDILTVPMIDVKEALTALKIAYLEGQLEQIEFNLGKESRKYNEVNIEINKLMNE